MPTDPSVRSWTTGGRIAVNGEYPSDWGEEQMTSNPTPTHPDVPGVEELMALALEWSRAYHYAMSGMGLDLKRHHAVEAESALRAAVERLAAAVPSGSQRWCCRCGTRFAYNADGSMPDGDVFCPSCLALLAAGAGS